MTVWQRFRLWLRRNRKLTPGPSTGWTADLLYRRAPLGPFTFTRRLPKSRG